MKTFLILYIIGINLLGFCLMGIDKSKARRNKWRIREQTLFLVSLLFGSIGVLVGMYVFRHKTRHRSFVIGIPLILILQLLCLHFLLAWHNKRMGSPSLAVQHELSLIQELDEATIESFVSYQNLTGSRIASGSIGKETADAVTLFFRDFQYRILNEQIDSDTATVTVNITNCDMHALAQDLCTAIFRQTAAIYPPEEKMTTSDYYRLLYDTLSSSHYDTVVTTAYFRLQKDEQGWVILADSTLEDELVSGFISYINDPYILPASTLLGLQLDALKDLNAEQWKDYLGIDDVFATYNTDYAPQIDLEYVTQLAAAYDYEILKCKEDGDTTHATVRITSLDMPAVLTQYKKYLLEYAATTKSIRDNDVQVSNETSRLLLLALQENTETHSTDIDLTFHNNGQTWEIFFDDAFTNAVMGDIDTSITTFNSLTRDSFRAAD